MGHKEVPVTHLRKMMLEELQRRNYSQSTVRAYIRVIRELTTYFRKPPDRLGPEHMRLFQNHLFRDRKLNAHTVVQYSAGLRFFFVKTLKGTTCWRTFRCRRNRGRFRGC